MILYTAWVIERRRRGRPGEMILYTATKRGLLNVGGFEAESLILVAMSTIISHKARRVVGSYEEEASRVLPL